MSDTRKRQSKCVKTFTLNDGTETSRASGEVTAVKFTFPGIKETLLMPLSELSPAVINAAAAFGLSTSVSNTFGAADMGEEDAFDAATSRWETLVGGAWSGERETGPRTSLLLEAAILLMTKMGKEVTAQWKEDFTAKLASGEVNSKGLLSKPTFAAAYAEVQARKAEERRRKAAEAAEAEGNADLSFLD